MERIKKAVELARESRQGRDPSAGLGIRKMAAGAVTPENVHYTDTRQIPLNDRQLLRSRLVAGLPGQPVSAHYKFLRTQVLQRMESEKRTTLAVTSPRAGDGKTLTSINLAISIARQVNYTVLLVDLDFHAAGVNSALGLSAERGLIDYLQDDVALGELLVNPGVERLVVLPSGNKKVENSSELLSSPKMRRLVEEIKRRYESRLIIFDLPPLLVSDDALAFLPSVDGVLLVIQDNETRANELERATGILQAAPLLGTVLNKSDEQVDYGYS